MGKVYSYSIDEEAETQKREVINAECTDRSPRGLLLLSPKSPEITH